MIGGKVVMTARALVFVALLSCAHDTARAPDPTPLRKDLAKQAMRQADWPQALEILGDLYRGNPEDPEVLTLRGVALREQGLLSEAETELAEAVRLAPDYAPAQSALGILLNQHGRLDEALPHHRRAVEIEPTSAEYLNNLAFAQFASGEVAKAIDGYLKALRFAPNDSRIRNNLGFAYARNRDFAKAAEQFRHAGTPSQAKNNLGYAYELEGNLGQAFELYAEAARLDPDWPQPRRNLARVANELGRPGPDEASNTHEERSSGKEQGR